MDDFFGKGNQKYIFGDASNAIGMQQFLNVLLVIVFVDHGLVGLEDEGKGFANGDGDWDGGDELDLSVGLDCHFYLLEDHQQLRNIIL